MRPLCTILSSLALLLHHPNTVALELPRKRSRPGWSVSAARPSDRHSQPRTSEALDPLPHRQHGGDDEAGPQEVASLPQERLQNITTIDRVFCLSDLHTDHADNLEWLRRCMSQTHWTQRDLLVVAGDISHDMDVFRESMRYMTNRCQVFFVWGNHEAWLHRHDTFDSLDKIDSVMAECRRLGVHVDPCYLHGTCPL